MANEMRTAFDHFISEARNVQEGLAFSSLRAVAASDHNMDGIEVSSLLLRASDNLDPLLLGDRVLSPTTDRMVDHTQKFRWSFEDIQVENLEIYRGDSTCSGSYEAADEMKGVEVGVGPKTSHENTSYSYSTVNRPVRVLIGRKELI
jgi:hypothetical protein